MKEPLLNSDLVGAAVCRFGGLVHNHDGDEMRANRVSDETVFCIFCGRRGPSTIDALLNGEPNARIVRVDSRLDYRFAVTLSNSAWASLVFERPDQFDDSNKSQFGSDFGEDYVTPPAAAKFPEKVDQVARKLANIGFRVTGSNATNTMGTLIMVLGHRIIPGRDALDGVKVELSWLY